MDSPLPSAPLPAPLAQRGCPRPPRRRPIPAFHPVPLAARHDGWSVARQAEFIGWLAETGGVSAAARLVGMSRKSAYRLRARAGAAGFAAAWDAALGAAAGPPVRLGSAKDTGLDAQYRFSAGLVRVVIHNRRFVAWRLKSDDNTLLQLALGQRRGRLAACPGRHLWAGEEEVFEPRESVTWVRRKAGPAKARARRAAG